MAFAGRLPDGKTIVFELVGDIFTLPSEAGPQN